MASRFLQGKFTPKYPNKYMGCIDEIYFRSSWELAAFRFVDSTPEITAWSSETLVIPYLKPMTGRMHRYFIDLIIWIKQADGSMKKFLVEIKPHSQTIQPTKRGRKSEKTYIHEVLEYSTNKAKWDATREYCKQNNCFFILWTEKELFPSQQKMKVKKGK